MHDPEEMDEMLLETQPFIDSDDPDPQFPVGAMTRRIQNLQVLDVIRLHKRCGKTICMYHMIGVLIL